MESIKAHAKPLRLFFFWSGVIATLAYRVINILTFIDPFYVKFAWYVGTIGFIIYFGHRYDIQKKRAELVEKYDLVNLIEDRDYGEWDQKEALHYIVKTTLTSKAQYNSLFIFIISMIVLIVGVTMDLM